jgi:hypothetical protein
MEDRLLQRGLLLYLPILTAVCALSLWRSAAPHGVTASAEFVDVPCLSVLVSSVGVRLRAGCDEPGPVSRDRLRIAEGDRYLPSPASIDKAALLSLAQQLSPDDPRPLKVEVHAAHAGLETEAWQIGLALASMPAVVCPTPLWCRSDEGSSRVRRVQLWGPDGEALAALGPGWATLGSEADHP